MTLTDRYMPDCAGPAAEEALRRQIASATQRLSRYRLARDRARLNRLKSQPELAEAIATLLRIPA